MTPGLMKGAGAIGAITEPSLPRRGASPIGLRARTEAAAASSGISTAGSRASAAFSSPVRMAMLWKVPPDTMSEAWGLPGRGRHLDLEVHAAQAVARLGGRQLGQLGHEQVRREGLEPAHLDELDPGLRGPLVVGVDDLAHERQLAREVGVVGVRRPRRRRSPDGRSGCRGRRGRAPRGCGRPSPRGSPGRTRRR